MKYKYIRAGEDEDFEAIVNQYIADGWIPIGGISVVYNCGYIKYQAMILNDTDDYKYNHGDFADYFLRTGKLP